MHCRLDTYNLGNGNDDRKDACRSDLKQEYPIGHRATQQDLCAPHPSTYRIYPLTFNVICRRVFHEGEDCEKIHIVNSNLFSPKLRGVEEQVADRDLSISYPESSTSIHEDPRTLGINGAEDLNKPFQSHSKHDRANTFQAYPCRREYMKS